MDLAQKEKSVFVEILYHARPPSRSWTAEQTLMLFELTQGNSMDFEGFLLRHAASKGYLAVIEHISKQSIIEPDEYLQFAALEGHINVLSWAKANNFVITSRIMYFAIQGKQVETIKWLLENGYSSYDYIVHITKQFGHKQLLSWMIECGRF